MPAGFSHFEHRTWPWLWLKRAGLLDRCGGAAHRLAEAMGRRSSHGDNARRYDIAVVLEIILASGVAGEVIVPWMVIVLSNWLSFDVPFWALGPIFAGPITLALATALVVWVRYVRRSRASQ